MDRLKISIDRPSNVDGLTNGNGMINGTRVMYSNGLTNGNGLTDGNGLTNGNGLSLGNGNSNKSCLSPKSYKIKNVRARTRKNRILGIFISITIILAPLGLYLIDFHGNNSRNIIIDNEFDDWENYSFYSDIYEDQTNNINVNLINYLVIQDAFHISFYLEVYGSILNGIEKESNEINLIGPDAIQIFLDVDRNPDTGYSINGIGADYLIEIQGYKNSISSSCLKSFNIDRDQHDWHGWDTHPTNLKIGLQGKRLEGKITLHDFQDYNSDALVLFHIQDSDGNEDFSDIISSCEPGVLKVFQNTIASPVLELGGRNVEFLELILIAKESDINVNQIILTAEGTFDDEDIDSIKLFLDDGNGFFDDSDLILGNDIFSNREIDFEFEPPLLIGTDEQVQLFVILDVSIKAGNNHVIGIGIESLFDVNIDEGAVTIETEDTQFSYIGAVSNEITIDGAFKDWERLEGYFDSDDEDINKENVDVNEYKFTIEGSDLSLYFKVEGTMMGGTLVPLQPGFVSESKQSKGTEFKIDTQQVKPISTSSSLTIEDLPELFGEDTICIFIDTDMDPKSGFFNPTLNCGADYLIQIRGKACSVLEKSYLEYIGTGTDWAWDDRGIVEVCSNGNQLETQIELQKINIEPSLTKGFNIFYLAKDWAGTFDNSDEAVIFGDNDLYRQYLKHPKNNLYNNNDRTVIFNQNLGTRTTGTDWFQWSSSVNTGGDIYEITVADLDNDNNLEIIYSLGNGSVYVHEYGGTSNTIPTEVWNVHTTAGAAESASSVDVNDSDGDGKLEMIVGTWDDKIYIYEMSPGQLSQSNPSKTPVWTSPEVDGGGNDNDVNDVAIGDQDGDGKVEIIAVYGFDDQGVVFYENTGDNNYTEVERIDETDTNGPTSPVRSVEVAPNDLDGDNKKEVIIGGYDTYIRVIEYNGTGDNYSVVDFDSGQNFNIEQHCIDIGDVNNDGQDEAIFGYTNGQVYVLNNTGPNSYQNESIELIENFIYGIDCHDVNNDGKDEVLVASGKYVYYLNHTGPNISDFTSTLAFTSDGNNDVYCISATSIVLNYDNDSYYEVIIGEAFKSNPTTNHEVYVIEQIPEFPVSIFTLPIFFILFIIAIVRRKYYFGKNKKEVIE
ncbi:FG-GAP-like repeat-containing protein [[Eubacterium] cellulosolvens]